MGYEYDPPRSSWPWGLVPLVGAVLGGLAVFGVIGVAWIADPMVYVERGTLTNFYPSDASALERFFIFGAPIGVVCGTILGSVVCRVAIEVRDTLGLLPAVVIASVLSGAGGGFAALPLAAIVEAPSGTAFLVAGIAGASGLLFTAIALAWRDYNAARQPNLRV